MRHTDRQGVVLTSPAPDGGMAGKGKGGRWVRERAETEEKLLNYLWESQGGVGGLGGSWTDDMNVHPHTSLTN